MKYRFMAAHRGEHRVEKMAGNLGVTRSGFYAWLRRGRAARQAADEHLRDLIEGIPVSSRRCTTVTAARG